MVDKGFLISLYLFYSLYNMKCVIKILCALSILLIGSAVVSAKERRALVIGIGQYQDPAWGRINADNDLQYISEILERSGYDDVVCLKNEQATKEAIVRSFGELTARCEEGDVVYIHFSGHGQQVKDLDGDEGGANDESWIPYDAYRVCCSEDDGSRHLIDDEVNALLTALRAKVGRRGQILVVVDACHSGGSSRNSRSVSEDYISRGVGDVFVPLMQIVTEGPVEEDWLLLSACEGHQINFEVKKPKVGKLTYCIYKLGNKLSKMSNDVFMEALTDLMDSSEMMSPVAQNPCLDGPRNSYNIKDVF